jgi:hypothetical protein
MGAPWAMGHGPSAMGAPGFWGPRARARADPPQGRPWLHPLQSQPVHMSLRIRTTCPAAPPQQLTKSKGLFRLLWYAFRHPVLGHVPAPRWLCFYHLLDSFSKMSLTKTYIKCKFYRPRRSCLGEGCRACSIPGPQSNRTPGFPSRCCYKM